MAPVGSNDLYVWVLPSDFVPYFGKFSYGLALPSQHHVSDGFSKHGFYAREARVLRSRSEAACLATTI